MASSKVIHSLIGQFEADLILGAKWAPMNPVDLKKKKTVRKTNTSSVAASKPQPVKAADSAVKSASDSAAAEKQKQLDCIAREVSKCTTCQLYASRTHTVPGQGNPNARIVFVGEAPGANEDEQGLPFVGRAGKLLTNIIEAMGLKREDVFICNILKCRPPDNRDPQATEIAECIEYLQHQLEIIRPEMIVALGAHAAKTLLDTASPIGQLRGKVHEYRSHPMGETIHLVATYHPAYLLRSYTQDNRMRVWSDMQMVLKTLGLAVPKKQK